NGLINESLVHKYMLTTFLYVIYIVPLPIFKKISMKKVLLSLGIVAMLISCNNSSKDFTLNGSITGDLENGTKIFLKKVDEQNQPVDIDTTAIENGKFTFTGQAGEPEIHYVFIDKVRGNIPFVMEKGTI